MQELPPQKLGGMKQYRDYLKEMKQKKHEDEEDTTSRAHYSIGSILTGRGRLNPAEKNEAIQH